MSDNTLSLAEQIKEIYLFRGVLDRDREDLLALMKPRTCAQSEILFRQGDAGDSLFVIVEGKIHIFVADEYGNEIPLRDFEPIRTLGELAVLDALPRSATARAVKPSKVLELYRNDFLAFIHTRPLVGLSMMRDLVERLRYTTDYVQKIMIATTRISEGKYDEPIDDPAASGHDHDLEVLIRAFADMVDSVKRRERALTQHNDT